MRAVKAAERQLLASQTTKVYEGPAGNQTYCAAIADLVLGDKRNALQDRLAMVATPGGCGALYLALNLLKRGFTNAAVWVSDPTWPNHIGVAASLDMEVKSYAYGSGLDTQIDLDALLGSLSRAAPGDVLIVQGPCHNPTGIDLSSEQWAQLGAFLNDRGIIPLIDVAYHGLGSSLDEDRAGVIALLDQLETACLSYSCSKNFGLYRERTGCLLVMSETADQSAAAASHLHDIARACYSMPPAHGAAIVETILSNAQLRAQWESELSDMRARVTALRQQLATYLATFTDNAAFKAVAGHKGMFSMLPLTAAQTDMLMHSKGLYLPHSGRVNVAGLHSDAAEDVAKAIAETLRLAP
ncbi:MAG: aromatic amino acid transaminase, partial [Pseudomonadota bacterium]